MHRDTEAVYRIPNWISFYRLVVISARTYPNQEFLDIAMIRFRYSVHGEFKPRIYYTVTAKCVYIVRDITVSPRYYAGDHRQRHARNYTPVQFRVSYLINFSLFGLHRIS